MSVAVSYLTYPLSRSWERAGVRVKAPVLQGASLVQEMPRFPLPPKCEVIQLPPNAVSPLLSSTLPALSAVKPPLATLYAIVPTFPLDKQERMV